MFSLEDKGNATLEATGVVCHIHTFETPLLLTARPGWRDVIWGSPLLPPEQRSEQAHGD